MHSLPLLSLKKQILLQDQQKNLSFDLSFDLSIFFFFCSLPSEECFI